VHSFIAVCPTVICSWVLYFLYARCISVKMIGSCTTGVMHCDPKWEQPQDITLAGMFFIIGRSLGDPSATKAVNQLLQKIQQDQQQQMVGTIVALASYVSRDNFSVRSGGGMGRSADTAS